MLSICVLDFQRNTIKRMCIKNLPPLLCIQLKRFGYDWEANRALKFDDYFKVSYQLQIACISWISLDKLHKESLWTVILDLFTMG